MEWSLIDSVTIEPHKTIIKLEKKKKKKKRERKKSKGKWDRQWKRGSGEKKRKEG